MQLALSLHNIDYVSHRLDPEKGEHKAPEYLALNPRGKVPTLKDGDLILRESIAILAYLNAKFGWQLFGNTPAETGAIWQEVFELENFMSVLLVPMVVPIFFDRVEANRNSIIEASKKLKEELGRLNTILQTREWLAGGQLTAADVAAYPFVQLFQRTAQHERAQSLPLDLLPLEEKYPQVSTWMRRLEDVPGVKETYPPHWNQ